MLDTFTIDTFSGRVGETFRIHDDHGHTADVELATVTGLSSPGGPETAKATRTPFSLVFRGARSLTLPQRIFKMDHSELGAFELFLVPVGPDAKGMCYEAVFT